MYKRQDIFKILTKKEFKKFEYCLVPKYKLSLVQRVEVIKKALETNNIEKDKLTLILKIISNRNTISSKELIELNKKPIDILLSMVEKTTRYENSLFVLDDFQQYFYDFELKFIPNLD